MLSERSLGAISIPHACTISIHYSRMGASYRSPSPHRRSESPASPRSPPGKVGTAMWGSNTPLGQKGVTPSVDATHWVCAVCYYTENVKSANKCAVCDSANTSNHKVHIMPILKSTPVLMILFHALSQDYQLKEQCKNCSFLNGHFASECEMCGTALKR